MAPQPHDVAYFASTDDFRTWLEQNHATAGELWVGFYKKGSGQPSLDFEESQEQALCFGWIDGVRMTIDGQRYANRFTPRRPGSNWSVVNINRVAKLTEAGLMTEAGLAVFAARKPDASAEYYRQAAAFEPAHETTFRADAGAWQYFHAQPPWYRRIATYWVASAKRPETRERRLAQLIADSAAGRRIRLVSPPSRR